MVKTKDKNVLGGHDVHFFLFDSGGGRGGLQSREILHPVHRLCEQ